MPDADGVPPGIESAPITGDGAFARGTSRGENELGEAVIEAATVRGFHAAEQVQQSEGILRAGFTENGCEGRGARVGIRLIEVDHLECIAESGRRVFEVRGAGADARTRFGGGASGDERLAEAALEIDPADGDAEEARAVFRDVERVGAAHVHRVGGGSVDEEDVRRRNDLGANGAAVEAY